MEDIFNKSTEENFQNLEKEMHIQVQKAYRTPKRQNKKVTSPHILEQKQYEHRVKKTVKEKDQVL